MGRKNRRFESYTPLDLTPAEIPKPQAPEGYRTIREQRADRDREWRSRVERQREARMNQGIDWSLCVVTGCGRELLGWFRDLRHHDPNRRDSTLELPICHDHAAVVWNQLVRYHVADDRFVSAIADVNERLAARKSAEREAVKAILKADRNGDIYFIRLNGLVKVGWTRDIHARVKSYGASAELLAYYPATRDDETNLHRQLRPALAKGREWYEDGPIVQSFIDQTLSKYGAPDLPSLWTTPKRIVAGKHHR